MKTTIIPCVGPALTGPDFVTPGTFWCNRHLHVVNPTQPNKYAIVIDTDHPKYGIGATLHYPSDSYPLVVVGGSKSGKTLYFARVRVNRPMGERVYLERDELLANMDTTNIIVARSRLGDSRYGDNIMLGWASYYLSREV
jgi:hypothetical protein